jgi:hypothetical protein
MGKMSKITDLNSGKIRRIATTWLVPIGAIVTLSLIITLTLYINLPPDITSCLDKTASSYCKSQNMSFGTGNYGARFLGYRLSDDVFANQYDFSCITNKKIDPHITHNKREYYFRFTMSEAKSCGYKEK